MSDSVQFSAMHKNKQGIIENSILNTDMAFDRGWNFMV